MSTTKEAKWCRGCDKVFSLEGFYRAGKSWQKDCKKCHNLKRNKYKHSRVYIKKPTGFLKLPEELQKKIIFDVYIRINFTDICKKYKDEYPGVLNHSSLLRWNRTNQIKKYQPREDETHCEKCFAFVCQCKSV